MDVEYEVREFLLITSPFLSSLDITIANEFIDKGELGLAVEFLCDLIRERIDVLIPEKNARKVLELARVLKLEPKRTWVGLPIREEVTDIATRFHIADPGLVKEARAIIEACKDKLPNGALESIYELFDHDEGSVGFESFCDCLILRKEPISREIFNRIQAVMIRGEISPEEHKGFVVRDETNDGV